MSLYAWFSFHSAYNRGSMLRPRSCLLLFVGLFTLIAIVVLAFVFDLVPASLQAPRVVSVSPPDGARAVLPNASIALKFSAPMDHDQTQVSVQLEPRIRG